MARLSMVVMVLGLLLSGLARVIAGSSYGVVQTIGYVTLTLGLVLHYWPSRWRRSDMKRLDRAKWERLRAKGQRHYVFVWGVLYFGLTLGLLMSALQWIGEAPTFRPWPDILVITGLCALAGILAGIMSWSRNEDLYWGRAER